ncbi:glycosyltransferase family 4 protein [Mongoliitalea lutea]|uniref:Uncharacterized protein n=1 Tax=Mongoliitalea lutea TaxID=849756 RepID=A0A8J3CY45_9BACT|nr:glycosyltransferase family 4 protein [Mongoliitalea lutea]GHB37217.1 hypothetical protein GCM10008106_18140 [Mongoliitalea lutea]
MILLRKIKSAFFHFNNFRNKIYHRYASFKEKKNVHAWFKILIKNNPKVFIGSNINKPNGVDFHIRAIHKYVQHESVLMPEDKILQKITMDRFLDMYLKDFELSQPAVLHSHVYPKYINWCLTQRNKNKSIKWVHTFHAHYFEDYAPDRVLLDWQKEFNRVFVDVASQADIRISVSKWQQLFYKENFNIDTIYIPNGVDVQQCERANPNYFKNTYGLENFILNVSRHDPVKNPREFVALAQELPDYTFVIIGSEFSEKLFQEHYQIKPPKNLRIFDKMTQMEVQHAIAASRCLVSTSKKEGLPTLVLEAMAQAKPVVVSNEPGSMEAIDNGKYGYFYTLGNIEELKNTTLEAIADKEIGAKARQRILKEYDWRVVAEKLDAIYSSALNL